MKVSKENELIKLQKMAKYIFQLNQKQIPIIINKILNNYKIKQIQIKELNVKLNQLENIKKEIKIKVDNAIKYTNETNETIQNDSKELHKIEDKNNIKELKIEDLKHKKVELKYKIDILEHKYKIKFNQKIKNNEKYAKMKIFMEEITGIKIKNEDKSIKLIYNKEDKQGIIFISCLPEFKIIKTEPLIPLDELISFFENEDTFSYFLKKSRELFFD